MRGVQIIRRTEPKLEGCPGMPKGVHKIRSGPKRMDIKDAERDP
jgi:hypothetical protein